MHVHLRMKSLLNFILVTGLCLVTPKAWSQSNVHPFTDDEFISDWLICGPFPSDENENISTDFFLSDGGEAKINPEAGSNYLSNSIPNGKVQWQYAKAEESGRLNFRELITPNQKNVVYAAAVIECEQAQPVMFKFGSNDRLKVWLNGKLIHFYSQVRAGGPDTDHIPAGLKKGKNLLLAKVDNDGGNWWLYARYKKLTQIDDNLFVWGPEVNEAAKRISDNEIADLFNVMIFNASETSFGPVTFSVGKGEGRDEKSLVVEDLEPGGFKRLNLESPVKENFLGKDLKAKVYIQTPSTKKTFSLSAKRKNIQNGKTYLVQGFHVDPVWRDSQSGYQALSFSNVSQFLEAGQVDPLFGIYLHEIPYLKPYYGEHPKERVLIREMIRTGQIETGGSYNQPNETTISGEGLIRNILYGRLFHENVLKDYPRVYTPWDVFGHIIQLPQILSKSEFVGTTWERGNYRSPFVRVPDIPDLYHAMAPDGTTILNRKIMYSTQEFTSSNFHDLDLKARDVMARKMKEQREQIPGIEYNFFLDALDEKPPTPWYIGRSKELSTFVPEVTTRPDGAEQYFLDVLQQEKKDNLDIPVVSRDESQYNEGCELSRFDLKLGNRLAENTLISAEKFGTIANLLGYSYPANELDKAWRQLLYGQHHDGITGCGADVPYLDLTEAYHEALELSCNVLETAQAYISEKINTSVQKGIPFVVFNPLNWERNDVVSAVLNFDEPVKSFEIVDEKGNKSEFEIEVLKSEGGNIASAKISFLAKSIPSVGYKTYWAIPSDNGNKDLKQSDKSLHQIENEFFSITCDENMGGGITSILDKSTGKEYINKKTGHPGNELIQLKEGGGFEPAWRFLTTGEKRFSKDTPCEIEVEENIVGKKLIITGTMDRMKKRIQEITLYNGVPRIDFRTTLVDYTGMDGKNLIENDERPRNYDRDLYCIGFPVDLDGAIPIFEDRFAVKSYFKSKGYLDYYSTDVAWTSQHAMNSCNNWLDYGYSVKVDFGAAGSIAVGPSEIITSHSSLTRKLGFSLLQALAKKGVTATPSYDSVKRGEDILYRHFSFSLGVKGENEYTNKLYENLSSTQKKQVDKDIKENGFAFFFTTDSQIDGAWFDMPVLNIIGKDEASLSKAVDVIITQLEKKSSIGLNESVCMVKLKDDVPDFGMALLNKGNIAVSIENDGTMVLPLMHTVPWQSPLLSWTHDFPERKTHVFEYALVPHKGNWREADLVKKGMEFNNPSLVRQTTAHSGSLPSTHSFFSTDNSNVIVSAIKPKTNGVESYSGKVATDAENGVIVRIYEANGTSSDFGFASSFPMQNVKKVNLMERNPESVTFSADKFSTAIASNSIETYLLNLKGAEKGTKPEASAKSGKRIYSSYWQHNSGAAPLGNLPVTLKILGDLNSFNENSGRIKVQSLEVAVSNDYTDTSVKGKIKITTPPGIRAVPEELEYTVASDSEKIIPFDVVIEGHGAAPGFVVATTELDGNQIFDVKEYILPEKTFGHNEHKLREGQKLSWTSERNGNELIISLENPFAQEVCGNVSLIGPVETWGMSEVNPACLMEVANWRQDFVMEANSTQKLHFVLNNGNALSQDDVAAWLAAKLTYFGYTDYKPVMGNLEAKDENNSLSDN